MASHGRRGTAVGDKAGGARQKGLEEEGRRAYLLHDVGEATGVIEMGAERQKAGVHVSIEATMV
jgi:hypothetical protein